MGDLLPHTRLALNVGRTRFPVIRNEEGRSQAEAWWGPWCWEHGSRAEEVGRVLGRASPPSPGTCSGGYRGVGGAGGRSWPAGPWDSSHTLTGGLFQP